MGTRGLALILAVGVLAFVGTILWTTVWTLDPRAGPADQEVPTAKTSVQLSDGRMDVGVYALGNLNVRLEIRFMPDPATEATSARPDVILAMVDMHMDGFSPPLELVGAGEWRTTVRLPMAGRWVASVGYAEDLAEVEFDAQ